MSLKNNFVVGLTAALAATVIAPVLVPVMKRAGRPLAKSLVRGGLMLYESSREAVARAGETMEDVIAEVRAEEMATQSAMPGDTDETSEPPETSRQVYGNGSDQSSETKNAPYVSPAKEGRVA